MFSLGACDQSLVVVQCDFFLRYESPQHIVEDFYKLRMEYYHRRKQSLLDKLQKEWSKLDNKVTD